ncbi:hypothetical protein Rai3103_05985 [Raineyella fluvialis]|uniref:Ricin B lectin domain-containing protein n=1 Tax=Raineyella fluvialis TaxID=2662261 RepID=A0A5Q2F9B9_9ACTN|nr:hypothetical protein Rai3103_05985 [Raineyella fluvialis]
MSIARTTMSRLTLTVLLVAASVVGLAGPARAASVTSIVFNNVSNSAALNTDPSSWSQVDDVAVSVGGVLYLPASAAVDKLAGWVVLDNGAHEAFQPGDYTLKAGTTKGDYTVTLTRAGATAPITVHQSAQLPAMYVRTGSGLAPIEADKDFKDTGATMAMVDAHASTTYNNALAEMKGRGNTTWNYPKKPYQIKLASSTELVPDAGAHKTWILLANYLDASLVRNELAYNLEGAALTRAGAPDWSIKGRMVDVFIDGDFRGSYYLTEKVQVGATRVAITDLQKANEAANPGITTYASTTTASLSGAPGLQEATYVPFPNTPTGYDQSGYLLEMDFATDARLERSSVITRHGTPFVLKGPEDANASEVSYIGNRLQKLEDAVYSPTGKNADGTDYSALMDVPSWARYYVMQEMMANDDGFKSSTYFHLDQGGKLAAGPMWDFDRALGSMNSRPPATDIYVAKPTRLKPQWINQLMAHESFRSAVQEAYASVVGPEVAAILTPGTGHLDAYAAEVARSAVLNKLRWGNSDESLVFPTPAQDIGHLRTYLTQRNTALAALFGNADFNKGALLPDGDYTIANKSLTLDVSSSSLDSGANVQVWTPNSTGAQTFRVHRGSDGLYTITNVNSLKALDVQYSAAANGTNVWQYSPNASSARSGGSPRSTATTTPSPPPSESVRSPTVRVGRRAMCWTFRARGPQRGPTCRSTSRTGPGRSDSRSTGSSWPLRPRPEVRTPSPRDSTRTRWWMCSGPALPTALTSGCGGGTARRPNASPSRTPAAARSNSGPAPVRTRSSMSPTRG